LIRRLPRRLLSVWLLTARGLGIRLVYTVHDLVPHQETFDDDTRVQRSLLTRAAATICLSDASRDALGVAYPPPVSHDVSVIGEGPPVEFEDAAALRLAARDHLGIRRDAIAIVAAGHLEWYKGFDLLLDALSEIRPDKDVVVRLAGPCADPDYKQLLEATAERLRARGIEVVVDARVLPEAELDELLLAGDVAAFPFRSITNSGSLRRAAARRLAIAIPDIDVLRDVPSNAAIRFEQGTASSLVSALRSLLRMSPEERSAMGDAAHGWSRVPSWEEIGARTRDVYDRVLTKGADR
jgi:glycosyltransferase involved in cell wall biosynthesis